ncbi:MAG TPA: BON domain-containing protein [Nitriliruptorales bacterium]|nr:BON domain-containing protein [Nitriliruptorales bacterium]
MSFFGKVKGLTLLSIGAAAGAAASYFFDPDRGRTRRAQATDQLGAAVRDQADQLRKKVDYKAGELKGALAEQLPTEQLRDYDVRTLKEKVESEVLGRGGIDKRAIVVTTRDGVVELRGEIPTVEQRRELLAATRNVEGVREVVDLTHLPGETPPNVQPSLEASEAATSEADTTARTTR